MEKIEWERLQAPFPQDEIQFRVQSVKKSKKGEGFYAIVLAYVDARAAQSRLDEVFGPGGWQTKYNEIGGDKQGGIICELTCWDTMDDRWITKSDGAQWTDWEPVKGGISDAFKRACAKWGIGLYLYRLPAMYAKIEPPNARGGNWVSTKVKVWENGEQKEVKVSGHWFAPVIPAKFLPKAG